jgi:hypothetical protein
MRAEELKEPLRRFQDEVKTGVDQFKSGLESGLQPGSKPAPTGADESPPAAEPPTDRDAG